MYKNINKINYLIVVGFLNTFLEVWTVSVLNRKCEVSLRISLFILSCTMYWSEASTYYGGKSARFTLWVPRIDAYYIAVFLNLTGYPFLGNLEFKKGNLEIKSLSFCNKMYYVSIIRRVIWQFLEYGYTVGRKKFLKIFFDQS